MSDDPGNRMVYSVTSFTGASLGSSQRVTVGAYRKFRIDIGAQSVWYKIGDSTVVATAGTANESFLNAAGETSVELETGGAQTAVALIGNVGGAIGSVTIFG